MLCSPREQSGNSRTQPGRVARCRVAFGDASLNSSACIDGHLNVSRNGMTGARELVPAGVRNLLRDYWAGTTLGHIDDAFRAAHFEPDTSFVSRSSGQRRSLVDQYYAAIDWTSSAEVNRFLAEVAQPVMANLRSQAETEGSNADYARRMLSQLTTLFELDGYMVKDSRIRLMALAAMIEQAYQAGDIGAPAAMLPRLQDADADPWLAIGTAKEIIEHIGRVVITRAASQIHLRMPTSATYRRQRLSSLNCFPATFRSPDAVSTASGAYSRDLCRSCKGLQSCGTSTALGMAASRLPRYMAVMHGSS